ncbi:UNVERIFIED_CONTAM: hypothetical protein FKN15_074776 [Acipenser sinensis]
MGEAPLSPEPEEKPLSSTESGEAAVARREGEEPPSSWEPEKEELAATEKDAFVELYGSQRGSMFYSWPSLKTALSLAALGAVGITIGAYFVQK